MTHKLKPVCHNCQRTYTAEYYNHPGLCYSCVTAIRRAEKQRRHAEWKALAPARRSAKRLRQVVRAADTTEWKRPTMGTF